jgi:hypothetical protein
VEAVAAVAQRLLGAGFGPAMKPSSDIVMSQVSLVISAPVSS